MAVIIKKKILFGDQEIESKVIEPSGVLSKEDRLRAEMLDEVLRSRVPEIAHEVMQEIPIDSDKLRRWYTLGKKLRSIVEDRNLVLQSDIDNMLVWQAIWQYLPASMIPNRTKLDKPYSDKQHKRQDHLSLCYVLSNYAWKEISWIRKWSFVHEITARPSLLRDKRIFTALGQSIEALERYPTLEQFREIMKNLVQSFPTKKYRDTSLLPDEEIVSKVRNAVIKNVDPRLLN